MYKGDTSTISEDQFRSSVLCFKPTLWKMHEMFHQALWNIISELSPDKEFECNAEYQLRRN